MKINKDENEKLIQKIKGFDDINKQYQEKILNNKQLEDKVKMLEKVLNVMIIFLVFITLIGQNWEKFLFAIRSQRPAKS